MQTEGRIRRWRYIDEKEKYFRVILFADRETVHIAFSTGRSAHEDQISQGYRYSTD